MPVEASLDWIPDRLPVRCQQSDGLADAGVSSVSKDDRPVWGVKAAEEQRAVFQDP